MALMTIMTLEGGRQQAADLVASDPMYSHPATCLAIASLALAAINTLAAEYDHTPEQIVQTAALSAAEYGIYLEKLLNSEGEDS